MAQVCLSSYGFEGVFGVLAKKNISDTKAPEVKKQNGKTLQFQKKSSKRDFVFGGFLFFITIGIWGVFLQTKTAGFVTSVRTPW